MDELEKKAQKGLESFGQKGDVTEVKANLDDLIDDMLGEDEEQPKEKTKGLNLNWLYVSILVLGLALIAYMGFKDGNKQKELTNSPALYAQYFEVLPDAFSANERGIEGEKGKELDSDLGMEFYNSGDFKKAAELLKQQEGVDYLVFGAIAEMKNSNYASAIDLLLKSDQLDIASRYQDIIEWYLSLAYLKSGEIKKSKSIMKSIADGEHYKKSEAKSILKALD